MFAFRNIFFALQLTLLFLVSQQLLHAQTNDIEVDKVKKEADKLFQEGKYAEAYPLYSQLLSLNRKDPFYSYRFGVCMLYSDRRDPEKPIKYMERGVGELEGEDALMLLYHLGVAYHQAYCFGEAIRAFTSFRQRTNSKNPYYKKAEIRMQMCKNGIDLLQDISDLYVLKKYEVGYQNFFRSYDLTHFGGELVPKPEFLKSKLDKKSDEMQLIFYSDTHNVVYYSSLGNKKKGANKDIYRAYKKSDGTWTEPKRLGDEINTPYDEDFPYLLPDGKTLYFSSKGHNSMGGYDIFRSVYDEYRDTWSKPVNIDFAINTPFDDILFITDPGQRYAWFSSFRNSNDGRIMVFLVRIDKKIEEIEKLNVDMIAAGEIDFDDPNYKLTLEKIRSKASLDVNTDEEMNLDRNVLSDNQDNLRYNIPANPTDKDIIDITFKHVDDAEQEMFKLRNLRDESLRLADVKKREAVNQNKQSSKLYEDALNETDTDKRKAMMAEAVELAKNSENLMDESNVAMQMYEQYNEAANSQKSALERIQNQAGYIQQFALRQELDTSIVLLKKLIDEIDTFKIKIVEARRRIQADHDYVNDLQADVINTERIIADKEKQATNLLEEAQQYDNEAALTTYPTLKEQYQHAADSLRQEAANLQAEARSILDQLADKKAILNELMNSAEIRQTVHNELVATVENNELAMNINDNNNITNDNNTNNNSDNNTNNNNNKADNSNTNNNNINNANNANNTNNANNANNNAINVNNDSNTNNANNTNTNKNLTANNHRDNVVNILNSKIDSLKRKLDRQKMESDALALIYAQKNSMYNTRLKDWETMKDKVGDNPSDEDIQTSQNIQRTIEDLYNQLDVLSDLYSKSVSKIQQTQNLITELQTLCTETGTYPISVDSALAYAQLDKANDKISSLQNTILSRPAFEMQYTNLKTALDNENKRLAEFQNEQKTIQAQIDEINVKIEGTRSEKKKEKLRDKRMPLDIKNNELLTEIALIVGNIENMNDSLVVIETQNTYYNEFSNSVSEMSDDKLADMASSWKMITDMDYDDVLAGPDKSKMNNLIAYNNSNSNVSKNTNSDNSNYNNANPNNTNNTNNSNNNTNPDNKNNFVSVATTNASGLELWYNENTNIDLSKYDDRYLYNYQDLIQSDYYSKGAQSLMVRIASLKKLQKQNPDQADDIQHEIDALTKTMQAYIAESDAYARNADNNLSINNIEKPDTVQTIAPGAMALWHMNQYEQKLAKADSLRQLAVDEQDPNLKQRYDDQAQFYDEAARMHYLAANDIYGIWSNSRYENNNVLIAENQNNGTWVMTDASQLMIRARRLRSEAFNEQDFEKKQDILNQARELELQALALQEQTLADAGIDSPEKMITIEARQLENNLSMNLSNLVNAYLNNRNILDDYANDLAINNNTNDNINNNNNNNNNTNDINNTNTNDNTDANNNAENNNVNNTNNTDANNNTNNNNANNTNNNDVNNNVNKNNANNNNTNNNATNSDNNTERKALYYRVQIAASRRNVDPAQYFRNLDDVVAEFTEPWYRYMHGYFTSFNTAWAERNRVRPMGYADAFVVAYYDGKRIPIYEARRIEAGEAMADVNVGKTSPIANIANNAAATKDKYEMADINGLVYSVQVGVYATPRNSERLFGISPLIEDRMANGYYRYYAGVYDSMKDAIAARNRIRNVGVPDAFVVILYQGKKITRAEADRLIGNGIPFGGSLGEQVNAHSPNRNYTESKPVFMVQIGSFEGEPDQKKIDELVVSVGQPVGTQKENGVTLYTVGSFPDYESALNLKNQLADRIPDAFVVAFLKGKKIPVGEARNMIE